MGKLLPRLACLLFIPAILIATLYSGQAEAAINSTINFQGKLVNVNGTNVTDGNYSIRFRVYTSASADATNPCSANSCEWEETQTVAVSAGIFQVNLGSVNNTLTTVVDWDVSPLYLGIKIGADAEMSPRVHLTTSPYAFNADKLDGIDSASFVRLSPGAQQTGSINISGSITSGAVNGLTLTQAADGFTASGGTTPRTLTVSGANITIGNNIQPTSAGALAVRSNGANTLTLDAGGAAAINIGGTNANAVNIGNTTATTAVAALVGVNSSAFSIQGASGAVYARFDTANNRLHVGNPTPDSSAFLLVLDNKNTAGDPAGMNGAMYYNSANNDFRAYQNNRWTNVQPMRYAYLSTNRVTTSTAYSDVTDLGFAVDANTNYELVCHLIYRSAATNTGIGVAVNGPASPAVVAGQFISNSTATALNGRSFNAYNGTGKTTGVQTANANIFGMFRAYFQNGANAGTLQLRYSSEVNGTGVTIMANSYCRLAEL